MKKIAVSQRLNPNKGYYELREALDVQWGKLFKELEMIPIILPLEYDFQVYFKNIGIDGILLTGGNDLNRLNPSDESLKRDNFEKELISYGIENDIPIFGVCRGMQIIAEYFGSDFMKVKDQVSIKHRLKVNKKSKYFKELSDLNNVNSFHIYAIENLSPNLLISATNEKGIIKAVEHKKHRIFAQMWHSERENSFKNEELELIKKFYNK